MGLTTFPRAGGHEGALIHAPCSRNTPGTRTLIGTARNWYVVRVPILPSFPRGLGPGTATLRNAGSRGTSSGFPKRLTLFGRWARVQNCCEMPRNSSRLSYLTQPTNKGSQTRQWHHCVEPTAWIPRGCGEMMPFSRSFEEQLWRAMEREAAMRRLVFSINQGPKRGPGRWGRPRPA